MGNPNKHAEGHSRAGLPLLVVAVGYFLIAIALAIAAARITRSSDGTTTVQGVLVFLIVLGTELVFVLRASQRERGADLSSAWAVIGAVALVIALPAAAVSAMNAIGVIDKPETEELVRCPTGKGRFTTEPAVVMGHGPEIRSGATVTSQVVRVLKEGECKTLPFVGYCIGEVVYDATNKDVPDSRWFILPKRQGLIPSGHTAGNPPPGMAPQDCPGGVDPPNKVSIREAVLDRSGRFIRLAGYSPRAAFVGFAMKSAGGRWHRLGWDTGPEDSNPFQAELDPPVRHRAPVAAVACIAVDNPTSAIRRGRPTSGKVAPVRRSFTVRQPTPERHPTVACHAGVKRPK